MLKFSVLFGLAVTFIVTNGHSTYNAGYQKKFNILEAISKNGYPVQNYTVETEDGYLLDLFRIPYGGHASQNQGPCASSSFSSESAQVHPGSQKGNNYNSQESSKSQSNEQSCVLRRPVLLMPGLLSSADDFVLAGPKDGLAYIMADNGFDVFLGNVRGSIYGRKHTVLNPERDPAFWQFSFGDIGRNDLPAIIDKILQMVVPIRKIFYVGHMHGSTAFYVMASEKPTYNEKIYAMVALGPIAFMGHSSNELYRLVSRNMQNPGWVAKYLGPNEFRPSQELISEGGEVDCMSKTHDVMICKNVFFLLNGYNSGHLNATTIEYVKRRSPSGSSSKDILHYAQSVKTGLFTHFLDDRRVFGRNYKLHLITAPVVIYYTPHDTLSKAADVNKLAGLLPTVRDKILVDRFTNNLDFLFGRDVGHVIYRPMMEKLVFFTNNHQNNNPNSYQNNNPNNFQNNPNIYQNNPNNGPSSNEY